MQEFDAKTFSPETLQFLSGGGEMGALIRAKDWSTTRVGEPCTWPQSLRTTLSIILNSKFPMFLFWGPDLICFYNDAYRPSLGKEGKHPGILGSRGEDYWKEIWKDIKPIIDQVLSGGEANWNEDMLLPIYRNGKIEDVYWTFSYSPVKDESGKPAGVFVTCTETTEKVVNFNELKESKNQLQFAIDSADLAAWDIDPVTKCFTGNSLLKEWHGLAHGEELTLEKIFSVVKKEDREPLIKAVEKALDFSSGSSLDQEYTIIHPVTTQVRIVRAKGKTTFAPDKTPLRLNGILIDVTGGAITKKKVEESESRLRSIVMHSPVGKAIVKGRDYVIELANPVMIENIWRRKSEEVIGNKLLEVFPELKQQKYVKLLNEVFESGETHKEIESVAYIQGSDGLKKFYLDFQYTPLMEADRNISAIMITFIDVTEKVEARQKIEDNEERLNIVIDAGELGTWELNFKSDEAKFSKRFCEIFGYKETDSLLHTQILNQVHPDDLYIRNNAIKDGLQTGIIHYEIRIIWNDSSIHWIEVRGKVFYDEKNEPVKLLGTIRDVTDEKNYQQILLLREERFRLLANSMPQFVWTGDAEGNINYFNQSLYEYSGLTVQDMNAGGWIQIVHPDERKENIKAWEHSVKTGTDFLFEHRFRRRDGEYRWQLSRAIPQRDATGKIQMWVGTSTDIQEMKEQDQQKDYFISLASHELKTPITSIKAYTQILQSTYAPGKDSFLTKSLNVIDKQIIKLTNLISDLLDVSKIKSGSLTLHKENFEITELIQEIIDEIKHINPEYKINFSKNEITFLHADRERIGQVITNLLTNAVKYSPQSGVIEVESLVENNKVIVSVEDFGIGIEKNDQQKIFERFYRVEGKSEKTFPGFGIGLFISTEIVRRHGGEIGVNSELGKGSVFYFSIPLAH